MEALVPPTADEAVIGLQRVAVEQLETMTEKNNLGSYRELATEMLEKHDAVDLVAAALKTLTKDPEDAPVSITEERPLPSRGGGGYKGKGGGGRSSGGGYKGKGGGRPSSGGYKGRRESSSSSRPSGGGRPGRTRRHES